MNQQTQAGVGSAPASGTARDAPVRGPLFRKYAVTLVAVVLGALVINGALDMWFSYKEQKVLLIRLQQSQADAAAGNISQFIKEIEGQLGWATLLPWSTDSFAEWRFDAVRLLRQVPAISEVAQLDGNGRELFRVSRHARDVVGGGADFSLDPLFTEAVARKVFYGPVYFVGGSEPHMPLAMAGTRRSNGVVVAQVNLRFIWDVVSAIKVGQDGSAYVIDRQTRLIAHPDISLVLRNTDLSRLPQVAGARALPGRKNDEATPAAVDSDGRPVLSVHATVPSLDWLIFVELPMGEALAPVYNSVMRSGASFLAALALALLAGLLLARRMVGPIRRLHDGAARIARGDLSQRISIRTGDELEALGHQFNAMASRLQESYATLERKVEERTQQLENANQAKSRFLAAASHDLRQPMHALGMFVAQLNDRMRAAERRKTVARIEAALAGMNDLFATLLDISKLDAGAMKPAITEFPVDRLLTRVESTFAGPAQQKGLKLRVVPNSTWIRTDFVLLERIVFNLVSNAVRYTTTGGIVVGCRRGGDALHFDVCDSGVGIPADQQQHIFDEFYRLGEPDRDRRGGLGLGLAIVDRLCRMLDHPLGLHSIVGKGSRFRITVPCVAGRHGLDRTPATSQPAARLEESKLVVVVDDDVLVQESMGGLFRSWGCRVIAVATDDAVVESLKTTGQRPDLIISDYHLADGRTGVDAIDRLRSHFGSPVPAFLISGDTKSEPLQRARERGYHLLHKPVEPMQLRAMLGQALKLDQQVGNPA